MTEGSINESSLAVFIKENETVAEVDEAIASVDGIVVGEWETPGDDFGDELYADTVKKNVALLRFLRVDTLQDLEAELRRRKEEIPAFWNKFTEPLIAKRGIPRGGVLRGTSVFWLANLLAGQTREHDEVKEFLRAKGMEMLANFPVADFDMDEEAQRIIHCYDSISNRPR